MLINSSKLRAVFGVTDFKQIMPPAIDLGVARQTRSVGAGVREVAGMGATRYVLSINKDEAKYIGKSLHMSQEEKYVSFLNNYFVFKKVRNIEQMEDKPIISEKTRPKRKIKLIKP